MLTLSRNRFYGVFPYPAKAPPFNPPSRMTDAAAMGAEASSETRQPPVALFIGRPVAQGPLQGEQHRRAAHVAALAQHLSADSEVVTGARFLNRIEHIPSAAVRDDARDRPASRPLAFA